MPEEKWNLKVVLRKFIEIPIGFEFRGFVYEGKLNAISQYDSSLFVPEMIAQKDELEKKIKVKG